MSNGDLIEEVRKRLGLGEGPDRTSITYEEGIAVLKELAADIQHAQRAVGMVLWHMDPSPAELTKIAEDLQLKAETLRSWLTTYSRLRHEASLANVGFSMQQQLARIQNAEERRELWLSRERDKWTLPTLREAVDLHLMEHGQAVMPRTKNAGCKAVFDDRQVKANLALLHSAVKVTLAVSSNAQLKDMKYEEVSEGVYEIRFAW